MREPGAADVIVGSREAVGARRIDESFARHAIGRVFNRVVQLVAVPGVHDTQCGFKLFSGKAVAALFPHLTIKGFAFDVEILFLARHAGFVMHEVGVVWVCRRDSRVGLDRGAAAFADVVRIRWRHVRGRYKAAMPRPRASTTGGRPSKTWPNVLIDNEIQTSVNRGECSYRA